MLELFGENFTPIITVWFGDFKTKSYYRSQSNMCCEIPDVCEFKSLNKDPREEIRVPILLVRNDGIIYNTGQFFTYTPEPGDSLMRLN